MVMVERRGLVMALACGVDGDVNNGEAEHAPPNHRRSGLGDPVADVARSVEVAEPRPLSILVADDEAPLRWSISAILESAGHRVVEADDGQVALSLLQEQDFDVLVLDLQMPKSDGMALLRQVQVPPLIVIVYSAFAYFLVDAVRDAVGAKVFRYMQKPVPPRELIAAVNEAAAELDR
jgi:CheY-like chemotaxis protein